MNRFEVLRGFNMFLIIPLSIVSILGVIVSLITFNYVFAIVTIVFIALTFGLNATLNPLTLRAHQSYFPKKTNILEHVYYPTDKEVKCTPTRGCKVEDITFIPAAKIVTED